MSSYIVLRIQTSDSTILDQVLEIVRRYDTNYKFDESYDLENTYTIRINLTERYTSHVMLDVPLDRLRTIDRSLRYHIMEYNNGAEWPKSIRINKQGKKITTKRMTKFQPL